MAKEQNKMTEKQSIGIVKQQNKGMPTLSVI